LFKRFKQIKKFKAVAILVAIAFVLFIFIPDFYIVFVPVQAGNFPVQIVIEEGQSSRTIAGILKEEGLIRSELAFTAYVRLSGEAGKLKAGKYNFSGRLDVPEIAFILANGLSESDDIRLLVSEGFNVWEIDRRLVKLGLIKEGEFSSEYYNEEGYLFPDTYRINREAEGEDFTKKLRERMADNFKIKTEDIFGTLNEKERKGIIIVASILEKEARTERDMKLVSGIIYKRLELGRHLQVDATVTYGACLRDFEISISRNIVRNCDVTFQGVAREIKINGSYNTYIRNGLPPGPISNPGLKAISAALNPTKSDYLYYLTPRGTNDIIYSKTPAEHAANRKKYLGI